jgi:ubiquinone/menaquinone biosynthesis C-methylase UbiE
MIQDTTPKKEKVKTAVDELSKTYDELAGKAMSWSTQFLLREISLPENPVCLDVGSGTGISTFELAKKIQDNGTIYGIDFSQLMIDKAKKNAEQQDFTNIKFIIGDAEQLDFPDSTFDLVISNQTLPYIPNKQKALKETHRVLKPGGVSAHLFFGGSVYQEVIQAAVVVAGRHPEIPMFMEAVVEYRDDLFSLEDVIDVFESAGFLDHRIWGRHQVQFFDPGFWLKRGLLWDMWVSGLPLDVVDNLRDEMMVECRNISGVKGFKNTSYNIIAIGTRKTLNR